MRLNLTDDHCKSITSNIYTILQEARAALAWLRNTSTDDKNLLEEIQEMEREEECSRRIKRASWKSIGKI